MSNVARPLRLLFVVPYPPSPVRVRPYHLLTQMVEAGHRVTLATLYAGEAERDDVERLRRRLGIEVIAEPLPRWRPLINVAAALPGQGALQAAWCWQPALSRRIVARAHEWEVAHVEHLRGARYGLALREARSALPVVWDSVDCISHLFAQAAEKSRSAKGRLMSRLDLARTRRQEGALVRAFDRVVVTSSADRDALAALAGSGAERRIEVLPNGVDLDYFRPDGTVRDPETIMISGKMSYHANVSAALLLADEIMPRLWSLRPEARLMIVGKDPASPLRALERRHPGRVEVTGTVDDMRPYLRRATLAVAPMPYAAGIQNKVLEAMACATPVITNPRTLGALAPEAREALAVAEGSEGFAARLLALLDAPEERAALGAAGRRYVEREHDWRRSARRLGAIYHEVVAAREPGAIERG